uniref:Probable RuBisCO transcriptional regulator n=3 Tax=Saccharina TaxID=309357 RepID=A0A8K1W577_9PHAE|nr:lysR transcriptional regulator [Saccharina japonica]YP_010863397.1 lysR transcriptional regulator [Saccharina japonica x Saccharina latissima]QOV02277.1 lysR transcriptional regulator [Saccharina sp. ye-B]UFQ24815.1 lysR transcriptional regulator [Saccharina sp. Rongfu]WAX38161.1 lysR transcriptional regulator [Saccharina japonica cultivar 901]AFC40140.1 lysR transcriptional regulator [Saccharina japonica]UFQ24954.1 lysR transcriptional regulator [Saccharina sp. Rongfu]
MKYFPFSLEQLRIIQAIKNETTIKQAAKKLYLSQPALSLQIQKLEYEIDSPILDRRKKQIYFTFTGELILDYADRILRLCEEADKAVVYLKKLKRISLTIGSNEIVGTYILPKIIDVFCRRYSYTHVKLEIDCTNCISWNIVNGKVDIGIVEEEEIPKELGNSLYSTPYFKEEIVLILPKSHELKDVYSITKENLYNLDFITLKPDFAGRKLMDDVLKKFNIETDKLKIKLELNSIEAIKRGVQAGLGVSFVSILMVKDELYSKRLNSVIINDKNISKRLTLLVNLKINESQLSGKFYKYCFAILKTRLYVKFLNLDY